VFLLAERTPLPDDDAFKQLRIVFEMLNKTDDDDEMMMMMRRFFFLLFVFETSSACNNDARTKTKTLF